MPSPTTPLSVENEAIPGRRRRGIDRHIEAVEAALVLPATSVAFAREAVGAVGQRRRGEAPGPCSVGGGGAEQGGAVIDLDRRIGFRAAGQRQRIVTGDAVTRVPLSVENEAIAGAVGAAVSTVTLSALEAALVLPAASVAFAVRLWAPLANVAVA